MVEAEAEAYSCGQAAHSTEGAEEAPEEEAPEEEATLPHSILPEHSGPMRHGITFDATAAPFESDGATGGTS